MYMRFLPFLIVLFAFGVSGCKQQSNEVASPQTRPSGQKVSAFEPVAEPAEKTNVGEVAEPTGDITLRDALALALMHNPELKAFSLDIRISEARRLQASLWPNPELGVEIENVGGSGELSGFDGAESTIQLSQLIELGDKIARRKKVASLETKLAERDYQAKRLDVFTEVATAFIEVLAEQQRLELSKELLRLSEELVETVAKRVEAGKDSPLEQTKASVTFSKIKIQHQQAIQNLEFSRKQLASTWAGTEPLFARAAGQLDSLPAIPSVDELAGLIEQNPDVARWAVETDKARASLKLEKAKAVSDITLSGGFKRFNETDDNAIVFGISIPLPISDRNQGGKLRATHQLAKAVEQRKAAYIRIRMELVKAYQLLANAHTQATELNTNVLQGAQSVFEASRTGYTQGKLDYLNVLDSQRTLFEAKAEYIDALASFHTARTDVERLIGRPIDGETLSRNEDQK